MSTAIAIVEWNFTPPDYFEQDVTVTHEGHELRISQGKVVATVEPAVYDADPNLRGRLHTSLENRFRGVQLVTHKPYMLHDPTLVRVDADGKRHHFVELRGVCATVVGGSVDFVVTDKDGNIKVDTKQERVGRKLSMSEAICKHATDSLLANLLHSHDTAVRNPTNELVHLYEIRDALAKKFGNDVAARAALGIGRDAWSRLGDLCNDEPLRQGRHNGRHGDALRDATDAELVEARSLAQKMVEAYIDHLEVPQNTATTA